MIHGPKAWCTFAGRANVLALLARTDPDVSKGAKGLSLFIVPKERFDGHGFEMKQPGGGRLVGKADATPGYRGMHSFTLNFENYPVPAETWSAAKPASAAASTSRWPASRRGGCRPAGAPAGSRRRRSRRRRSTSRTARSSASRSSEYQLTQYTLGRMAALLAASRAITYAAARAMDEDERAAAPLAAQAKLLACDMAVEVTQQGQLMHGGWGYAEEYPISRYVVDAQVLPIFEGVKPILELKVVAAACSPVAERSPAPRERGRARRSRSRGASARAQPAHGVSG